MLTRPGFVMCFVLATCIEPALADCSSGQQTTMVFGNGIGTTWDEAQSSLNHILKPAILQALRGGDPACFTFALAYDSTFVDSNNVIISTANKVAQAADAAVQQGIDFAANFWSYWTFQIQPPSWLEDLQRTMITSATSILDRKRT